MKIAYFINQYPKVSHSFIRREINALEKQGIEIVRYALKTDESELIDKEDQIEFTKTRYLLQQPLWMFIIACFLFFIKKPLHFIIALSTTLRIGWKSDRGLLRHIIYFLEACLLARWSLASKVMHIHAHFGTNSATVVMLANLLGGVKYSFTVHGPEEFDKPQFISIGEKIKHATFVVAISSFGKSQLFRWVDYKLWNKVKIVHCGLEKAFYDIDIRPVRQNRKMVCVGRLCEQKGQLLLVKAAIILAENAEDFQFTLAGDGPMRTDIEALIEKHDLTSKITITGWISSDRVREEILDSCALILPSFAEGLPVVIMEAMALNRPVISTYIAGIPELVIPGENGWLVPAGSLESLVTTMRQVFNSPEEELQNLGKNARLRVIERHNIDKEANKLAEFFSGVERITT